MDQMRQEVKATRRRTGTSGARAMRQLEERNRQQAKDLEEWSGRQAGRSEKKLRVKLRTKREKAIA
jgi:hypothetical protein